MRYLKHLPHAIYRISHYNEILPDMLGHSMTELLTVLNDIAVIRLFLLLNCMYRIIFRHYQDSEQGIRKSDDHSDKRFLEQINKDAL